MAILPMILDRIDDAVEWETTVPVSGVPWLQARRGKANIVGFFEFLAPLKHPDAQRNHLNGAVTLQIGSR